VPEAKKGKVFVVNRLTAKGKQLMSKLTESNGGG
jgi:hypothetical protein